MERRGKDGCQRSIHTSRMHFNKKHNMYKTQEKAEPDLNIFIITSPNVSQSFLVTLIYYYIFPFIRKKKSAGFLGLRSVQHTQTHRINAILDFMKFHNL